MINLDSIIQRVNEFPTLPTIYSNLMDVMSNPRSSAIDVAEVISKDQASASKVLKAANSSLYGFHGRITNISQAILYIGFDEIKNLVTALTIIDLFASIKTKNGINPVNLWKHSIAVGTLARTIGKTVGANEIENYFLAGILHDLGKLLFYKIIPESYSKVLNFAYENALTIREAELKIIGTTHLIAGEILAEKWKLPVPIRNSIRYHHTGLVNGKFDLLLGCVHIANIAAPMFGFGVSGDEVIQEPSITVWDNLELPEKFFSSNSEKFSMEYQESVQLLLKY